MKNVKLFCLLFFPIIMGCENNRELNDDPKQVIALGNASSIIYTLGLDTASILDMGDYYVVEEDIIIQKDKLNQYLNDGTTRQAQRSSIVSKENAQKIKIKIDASLYSLSNWREAILEAISVYNNTVTDIHFTEVSSGYDILIVARNLGNDICGQGEWPSGNKIGPFVYLNLYNSSLSLEQKVFLIMHELGHTLGLRHTNWSNNGESSGIGIPGTPNNGKNPDPGSVMNAVTCGYSWKAFSYYDIVALQTLYPKSNIYIWSDILSVCDSELITYTIRNYSGPAIWEAVENATLVSGQGSPTAIFRVSGNGLVKVNAQYIYSGYSFPLNGNSMVWVGTPLAPKISDMPRIYAKCHYQIPVSGSPGSTYSYSVRGADIVASGNDYIEIKVKNYYMDGTLTIEVTATNQCGSSTSTISAPVIGSRGLDTPEI